MLRLLKVFDKSLIFILGDHGAGAQNQLFQVQKEFPISDGSHVVSDPYKINALPMLLVKPFGSKGEMKTSNAPISLSDIPATIFSQLGIQINSTGKDIFTLGESNNRMRRFIAYGGYNAKNDSYSALTEFSVTGPGWVMESWNIKSNVNAKIYSFGEPILFGKQGNALQYQKYGWGLPEDGFTWTVGKRAELLIPHKPAISDGTLVVDLRPFLVQGKLEKQRVRLLINDYKVGEWNATFSGEYKITFPVSLINDESIKIVLEVPDAISPAEMKVSNDPRRLSIALKNLVIW